MSQKQIHSLELLSMGTQELKKELAKEVRENPALIMEEADEPKHKNHFRDFTRLSTKITAAGAEAAEAKQRAMSEKADTRESLQSHLISQLNMMNIPESEKNMCEKVIYNLSAQGFHILSPLSLLDKKDKLQTLGLLDKAIATVQQMEPSGIAVSNVEESLLLQAKQRENTPNLVLYLLNGKFSFLDPPVPEKILKKISDHQKARKTLFATTPEPWEPDLRKTDEYDIEDALNYIRTLNPYPASEFSTTETHFVSPDIYVEKLEEDDSSTDDTVIELKGHKFRIRSSASAMPRISINPDFEIMKKEDKNNSINDSVKKARELIEAIEYRNQTLLKACIQIVLHQSEFFLMGPGNLAPLRQQDIADILKVHETTISRMANSKYIQCEWGMFDIKYFFVNAASSTDKTISKDQAVTEIKKIIEENKKQEKKLSDQKIADILAERGIKIARRTVAKYRAQLYIDSSYFR